MRRIARFGATSNKKWLISLTSFVWAFWCSFSSDLNSELISKYFFWSQNRTELAFSREKYFKIWLFIQNREISSKTWINWGNGQTKNESRTSNTNEQNWSSSTIKHSPSETRSKGKGLYLDQGSTDLNWLVPDRRRKPWENLVPSRTDQSMDLSDYDWTP